MSSFVRTPLSPRRLPAVLALLGTLAVAACTKTADAPPPAATAAAPVPAAPDAPSVPTRVKAQAQEQAQAQAHLPAAGTGHGADGVAWRDASSDAEVDAAFAVARAETKPVFVYWGAKWCPPCNQVKATLFNRQDFIARSRAFVPIYVDGDSPGAQKIGARFHVSGYPTMVLFAADGREVTRLPGEVEPARYNEVLTLGMNAARPVSDVLAAALRGDPSLGAGDWRLLAFYSWDTDQQLLAKKALPATLAKLAAACPADQRETAMRLRLKALAATPAAARAAVPVGVPAVATSPSPSSSTLPAPLTLPAQRAQVQALLADPAAMRSQADVLSTASAQIVRALAPKPSPARAELLAGYDAALARLAADPTLSRADRMQALIARVDLARIDVPDDDEAKPTATPLVLPPSLLAEVRDAAARADREITDGYERQAVVTAAAYLLDHAGLGAESDRLLEANLGRSHSPYYLMSALAGNAAKRGDKAAALRWSAAAYAKSEGPATRLQWGASYVEALTDFAPADEATIERTVAALWTEAASQPDAFYERSARSLQKVGTYLSKWNGRGAHRAAMARLQTRLDAFCAPAAHSDSERATCRRLLSAAPPARA